jgi:hypothetical protein
MVVLNNEEFVYFDANSGSSYPTAWFWETSNTEGPFSARYGFSSNFEASGFFFTCFQDFDGIPICIGQTFNSNVEGITFKKIGIIGDYCNSDHLGNCYQ